MSLSGNIIDLAVDLYVVVIIVEVAMHWLSAFDVINKENEHAKKIIAISSKLTEPAYRPIRKYLPPVAGFDLSPVILILAVTILGSLLSAIIG